MDFSRKRGIAPLVASLLLISFAVAIGITVMSFGRAQVELEAQCPINVGLHFASLNGEEIVCYDGNNLRFTVENGINMKVEGLIINIIGLETAETHDLNLAKIDKAGEYQGNIGFNAVTGGAIRQVKISPKIKLYDSEQICSKKALILEHVRDC